jgi:hypothetical protein
MIAEVERIYLENLRSFDNEDKFQWGSALKKSFTPGCRILSKKYTSPPPPSAKKMAKFFKKCKTSKTFIVLELFPHQNSILLSECLMHLTLRLLQMPNPGH